MSAAAGVAVSREALAAIAPLFAFPDEKYPQHIEGARGSVAAATGRAARSLDEFARAISDLAPSEREIAYTSTFDLAPSCSPYLGVQLFGDDSRDRARLMVGLRMTYKTPAESFGGELPDHLGVVLSFAPRFEEEEWAELVRLVLVPALDKMDPLLAETSNPFRHLVSTTRHLTRAALAEGGSV